MDWAMQNWEYVMLGVMVVDKVVAMSPSKMDDLIWVYMKKVLMGMRVLKKKYCRFIRKYRKLLRGRGAM